jgi:hypothetical protein
VAAAPVNVKTFRHNPAILRREQTGSKVDLLCRLVLSALARWWKLPIYRRCAAWDTVLIAARAMIWMQQSAAGDPAPQFAVGAAGRTPGYALHYHLISPALPVLERALASAIPRIVVEKPIVANLEQAARLRALLAPAGRPVACWPSTTGWRVG